MADLREFIQAWHARMHPALADALAHLASYDKSPVADGELGDWVDALCAMRFDPTDVRPIATLIDKQDPHLQEAGLQLARAALRTVDANAAFEFPLTRLVAEEIDPWVLEALVELLQHSRHPYLAVYQGLVRNHGKRPKGPGIMRNRHIEPWSRLERVYEQHAIQTATPKPRDLVYLPILEAKHATTGWLPTLRAILTKLGFDPDQHIAMLQRFS
jgi:hypothetical protein